MVVAHTSFLSDLDDVKKRVNKKRSRRMLVRCLLSYFVADSHTLEQLARRQVRPTREHNAEVQRLLSLMGIPWVIVCILMAY